METRGSYLEKWSNKAMTGLQWVEEEGGSSFKAAKEVKKKTHVFMVIYLLTKCQGISTEIGESF